MIIQVFTLEDKEKLMLKGLPFICQQNIGDKVAYIFEYNKKSNFDLNDVKFRFTNKLYF